ncbi:hypothetical protein CYMTET_54113 [Cymbomonas tetramitiformis]|uniref:Uncharacterized protein n=1 Tax=Cymbomonas tetramitiformis TaxID=36881 RepID=A0AAE0BH29_9CHLO|nr:hypothetical protein CYMTET_54113 [Cymbomonas tetramitiformis]
MGAANVTEYCGYCSLVSLLDSTQKTQMGIQASWTNVELALYARHNTTTEIQNGLRMLSMLYPSLYPYTLSVEETASIYGVLSSVDSISMLLVGAAQYETAMEIYKEMTAAGAPNANEAAQNVTMIEMKMRMMFKPGFVFTEDRNMSTGVPPTPEDKYSNLFGIHLAVILGYVEHMAAISVVQYYYNPDPELRIWLVQSYSVHQLMFGYASKRFAFLMGNKATFVPGNEFVVTPNATKYTGKQSIDKLNRFIKYANTDTAPDKWMPNAAREDRTYLQVDGHDGDAFEPMQGLSLYFCEDLKQTDTQSFFVGKLGMNNLKLAYSETKDLHAITLHRFELDPECTFDYNCQADRLWYFQDGDPDDHRATYAMPTGLSSVTSAMNIPSYISRPHFMLGDPELRTYVTGLNQDPEADYWDYESFIDVEPISGRSYRFKLLLQRNFMLWPGYTSTMYPKITTINQPIPINYGGSYGEIPEDTANLYASFITGTCNWTLALVIVGPLISIGILVGAVISNHMAIRERNFQRLQHYNQKYGPMKEVRAATMDQSASKEKGSRTSLIMQPSRKIEKEMELSSSELLKHAEDVESQNTAWRTASNSDAGRPMSPAHNPLSAVQEDDPDPMEVKAKREEVHDEEMNDDTNEQGGGW